MSSAAEAEIGATFLNAKDTFTNLHNPRGTRTFPTPHSHESKENHSSEFWKQYNKAETVEGGWHALLLDQRLHPPGQLQDLMTPPEAPTSGTTTPNTIPQAITDWFPALPPRRPPYTPC